MNQAKIQINEQLKCKEVVDMIFQECKEETHIELTTLKGRNVDLQYENGVCIIK